MFDIRLLKKTTSSLSNQFHIMWADWRGFRQFFKWINTLSPVMHHYEFMSASIASTDCQAVNRQNQSANDIRAAFGSHARIQVSVPISPLCDVDSFALRSHGHFFCQGDCNETAKDKRNRSASAKSHWRHNPCTAQRTQQWKGAWFEWENEKKKKIIIIGARNSAQFKWFFVPIITFRPHIDGKRLKPEEIGLEGVCCQSWLLTPDAWRC